MFAIGCIQSLSCHTDRCPTGVATQDPLRQRALDVPDKAERVFHFHQSTLKALAEVIAAAGLDHPSQLRPHHLSRRIDASMVETYATLFPALEPGAILGGAADPAYHEPWTLARAESFAPARAPAPNQPAGIIAPAMAAAAGD
jgi:hypothetical protein